jgi:cell division cycle 2-like protein
VRDRERVGDRGETERRGEPDRAEGERLGDLVCDLSRDGLRARDRDRAGDGEGDGMIRFSRQSGRKRVLYYDL